MSSVESPTSFVVTMLKRVLTPLDKLGMAINRVMPKGLYARSLLIVILPVIILQAVVSYVFLERHWQDLTQRLSAALSRDVAALIDVYTLYPQEPNAATLRRIAQERLSLTVDLLPPEGLPPPAERAFFSILDDVLHEELRRHVRRPFWIDTLGRSNLVEIRIDLDKAVMRVIARRSQAAPTNIHQALVWVGLTTLVLLIVAVMFLRNQIKPIVTLAKAAESFGKGREVGFVRPRGAREVRQAAIAFQEMRKRIERQIEQRTTMLAGVSHDLRTVLTRLKLQLAFMGDGPEIDDMKRDVDEMNRMLEDYLAFARGDVGEQPAEIDMTAFLVELKQEAERQGHRTEIAFSGHPIVTVRPDAFKRLLHNLVSNAARFGDRIAITGTREARFLTIQVDDDGPGIPPERRDDVFRPFLRLDDARNVDQGGSGLGLTIARDIARTHGGDITLGDSPLGGLRATVRVPV